MIIDIPEFTPKELFFRHVTIITVSKYYCFYDKNFLGNHKCTASHYIIKHYNGYCLKYPGSALWFWNRYIPGEPCQYHGYWWPGSSNWQWVGRGGKFIMVYGHHQHRRKSTTRSDLNEAEFDLVSSNTSVYLVHSMSGCQLCLGFDLFGWLSFFAQYYSIGFGGLNCISS